MNRNAHILARARRECGSVPGLRVLQRRGRLVFNLNDQVLINFKKLSRSYRPSNYPTRQATDYLAQAWPQNMPVQGMLPGMDIVPPVTNLVAGYRFIDPAETLIELVLVCPEGRVNAWMLELTPVLAAMLPLAAPVSRAATPKRKRVVVRPGMEKQREDDTSAG